eukprot:jgi/Ulvmu1/6712/UM030_0045.1
MTPCCARTAACMLRMLHMITTGALLLPQLLSGAAGAPVPLTASTGLTVPTGEIGSGIAAQHVQHSTERSGPMRSNLMVGVDHPEELDHDELPGRHLLHGCHRAGCLEACPRCRFPDPRASVGHCKRNGQLFRCHRPARSAARGTSRSNFLSVSSGGRSRGGAGTDGARVALAVDEEADDEDGEYEFVTVSFADIYLDEDYGMES